MRVILGHNVVEHGDSLVGLAGLRHALGLADERVLLEGVGFRVRFPAADDRIESLGRLFKFAGQDQSPSHQHT